MELSLLLSSAPRFSDVRSRQIIASPPHTKHLGICNYPSSSQKLPSHIALSLPTRKNKVAFSFSESCSKLSATGTRWLKVAPVKAHGQQATNIYEVSRKNGVLWRFVRPFAAITVLINFSCILGRRLIENPHVFQWPNWSIFIKIFAVFTSLICASLFTTSINQIFDIKTDRINKPYLPLSSGELPIESAWIIVLSCLAISLFTAGTLNSVPFLAFDFCLLLLGATYSIPPFRTKASTIGALISNSMMLGFFLVFAMFTGAGAALGLPFQMSSPIIFIAIFSTIFAFAAGILKDIADVEGDKKSDIPTLATIIGVRKALLIGIGIQILNNFGAVLAAIIWPKVFKRSIMVPTHILSTLYLIYQAWQMEQANYESKQCLQVYAKILCVYFIHFFQLLFI